MTHVSADSSNAPVAYMARTRAYYRAQGYTRDYVWAAHDTVPIAPLTKPLSQLKLALVTTANPLRWDETQPKSVWSGATATPPAALHTDDLAWDKENTHTNDVESFLPIGALQGLVNAGELGSLTTHYFGLPSEYSQAKTIGDDAPELLSRIQDDGADAVMLVPL